MKNESESVSLGEAASKLPGHPHLSTLVRWATQGVRGCRLETFVRGGRRFTTTEALERFIQATTAASNAKAPKELANPIARERERQISDAEAICRRAGI